MGWRTKRCLYSGHKTKTKKKGKGDRVLGIIGARELRSHGKDMGREVGGSLGGAMQADVPCACLDVLGSWRHSVVTHRRARRKEGGTQYMFDGKRYMPLPTGVGSQGYFDFLISDCALGSVTLPG